MNKAPLLGMEVGPFEEVDLPDRLKARAVSPGAEPRLWGYDVQSDLVAHYSFAEVVLLALTGEAPEPAAGRGFEVALTFLAPIGVGEAPANAAVLARVSGSQPKGVLSVAAVGLAEQAGYVLRAHAPLLTWLDAPEGPLPEGFGASGPGESAAVARLRAALAPTGLVVRGLPEDLSLAAALLATCHACGLTQSEQLHAAWILARLAVASAEAFAAKRAAYRDYPLTLPQYLYVGGESDGST